LVGIIQRPIDEETPKETLWSDPLRVPYCCAVHERTLIKDPIGDVSLLMALVNHTRGGLSELSINNGRIPWFRDRAILD
jgi:hypothetical protein